MTIEEAREIYLEWQKHREIDDRIWVIFGIVPKPFLQYPPQKLEEALSIVAKDFFESGDERRAATIQHLSALHLPSPMNDEEALRKMKMRLDLVLGNEELLRATLNNLNKSREAWGDKFNEER